MWSKYQHTKSECDDYREHRQYIKKCKSNDCLDPQLYFKDLTHAICTVERKEKNPTVNPGDFERDMQISSPDQEYKQRYLFNVNDVVKHDVPFFPSGNVETNQAVPLTHQQIKRPYGGIAPLEDLLHYDANDHLHYDKMTISDLLNTDSFEADNLDCYIQPQICNQNSSQHEKNDYTITSNSSNFSSPYGYTVSSPGLSTYNESSEEESNSPSSPGVVQTKGFGKKKSASLNMNTKKRRKSEDMREPTMLWEFILRLLMTPGQRDCVKWSNEASGEFIIKDSKLLAASWGIHKCKQPTTYENLSRSLRYYYGEKILEKVKHRRLMYRFIKREQYMNSKCKFLNQSYLQNGDNF